MELGLQEPRHTAEQVLDAAGEGGHAVGLELAEVDHVVRLGDGGDELKLPAERPLLHPQGAAGTVQVQRDPPFLGGGRHAGGLIEGLQQAGGIEAAGAVRQGDPPDPQLPQVGGHRLHQQRMGGGSPLGVRPHNQIGLEHHMGLRGDLHPQALEMQGHRLFERLKLVAFGLYTGDPAHGRPSDGGGGVGIAAGDGHRGLPRPLGGQLGQIGHHMLLGAEVAGIHQGDPPVERL